MNVLFDLLGNKKMKRAMTNLSSLIVLSVTLVGCISTQSISNTSSFTSDVITMEYPSAFADEPLFVEDTSEATDSVVYNGVSSDSQVSIAEYFNEESVPANFDHSGWNKILKEYVDDNGLVNYKGLLENRSPLNEYIELLVNNIPDESWSRNEQLAYWMNAYNALTVDLILRNYPLNSIQDIKEPWKQRLWQLGDKNYNLDEIEHKILRKMDEPRIHFGIVCASFSCPKLLNEAFTADNVDGLLTRATREFLADPNRNSITSDKVELSKIFQWFAADFKTEGTIIDFINKYTDLAIDPKAKKRFKNYDWKLNE